MNSLRGLLAVLMIGGSLGLAACGEADGPAEKIGAAIDEAANDTKRAIQDAAD